MLHIQTYHNSNFPLLKYASNVPCFMQVCAALNACSVPPLKNQARSDSLKIGNTVVSRFSGLGPSTSKGPLNRDSPLNGIIPNQQSNSVKRQATIFLRVFKNLKALTIYVTGLLVAFTFTFQHDNQCRAYWFHKNNRQRKKLLVFFV